VLLYFIVSMESRKFYGNRQHRQSRFLHHIVSQAMPDDGNISDTGDVGDDDSDVTDVESSSDNDTDSESSDDEQASDDGDASAVDQWSTTCKSMNLPSFTADEGPFIILPPESRAIDYFHLVFPSSLWQTLVTETNRYAAERKGLAATETSEAELRAFLGVCMAMSIHKLPRIRNY